MTWLTKIRTALGHDEVRVVDNYNDPTAAKKAIDDSKKALEDARGRLEETRQISSMLADLNRRNHYGESIMLSMMPREGR